MRVTSREYKVIVDSSLLAEPREGLREFREELDLIANSVGLNIKAKFDVDDPKVRTVLFLDTPDHTLRQNGLLLRQRLKPTGGKTEYTLKHRTEDRYIATAADLAVAPGSTSEAKFEEDIGVPFVSRFSHSNSVKLDETARHAGSQLPATLGAAGELFPGLRRLRHDNLPCSPQTTLVVVNSLKAHELVFGGPLIQFEAATKSASVVLILWRKGEKGRVLTAELSFRYEDANEDFRPDVAAAARRFFQAIQRADWARPEAMTKTQFMYGAAR